MRTLSFRRGWLSTFLYLLIASGGWTAVRGGTSGFLLREQVSLNPGGWTGGVAVSPKEEQFLVSCAFNGPQGPRACHGSFFDSTGTPAGAAIPLFEGLSNCRGEP